MVDKIPKERLKWFGHVKKGAQMPSEEVQEVSSDKTKDM